MTAKASTSPRSTPARPRARSLHVSPPEQGYRTDSGDADPRGFFDGHEAWDSLANEMGESFIQSATSGESESIDTLEEPVPEDDGGPFVETSATTEFAIGTDESNPRDASREPFPTT